MKRKKHIFFAVWLCLLAWPATLSLAATAYRTEALVPDIATLRMQFDAEAISKGYRSRPYLTLGGEDVLDVSFDQLSHEVHSYTYTLRHLDYDWTPDDLMTQEYLDGDITAEITDYEHSVNTQQLYTHYRFSFPNERMQPTVSGNYVLLIYEDNNPERVVATVCFSVVEQGATIQAKLRSDTDIEYAGRYQQLDVEVHLSDPLSTLNTRVSALIIEQNNRTDNAVVNPKPSFVEPQRLRWQNNRALIFEGGNEYRHIDLSSEYFMGQGVDHITFDHSAPQNTLRTSGYHAYLFEDEIRTGGYIYNEDANGRYVINKERTDNDDLEADYMWVHWLLPADHWLDGGIYLMSDAFGNRLAPTTRMQYDDELKAYVFSAYLKQGGYEWLYTFYNSRARANASTERVEGSYWQTRNAYRLYYYYRGVSDRYTRLLSVKDMENILISN